MKSLGVARDRDRRTLEFSAAEIDTHGPIFRLTAHTDSDARLSEKFQPEALADARSLHAPLHFCMRECVGSGARRAATRATT